MDKKKWGIQWLFWDQFLWNKITAKWIFYLTAFFLEVFGSVRWPQSTAGVDPQSLQQWCWGSWGPTRVAASPATSSNTPSYWRSASAGIASGSPWCNTGQPSGSGQRRRSPLENKQNRKHSMFVNAHQEAHIIRFSVRCSARCSKCPGRGQSVNETHLDVPGLCSSPGSW